MSVAEEISRLQTAKSDIRTAIEEKGVDVPNEVTIDKYPEYIDEIQQGSNVTNGIVGEYLASTDTISANTFVEVVDTVGERTQPLSSVTSPVAVALNDTDVMLVYRQNSSPYKVMGQIFTFSQDGSYSVTEPVELSVDAITTTTYTKIVRACLARPGVVAIWWNHGSGNIVFRAISVSSDGSLSLGTTTSATWSSTQYSPWTPAPVAVNGHVVFAWQGLMGAFSINSDLSVTVGPMVNATGFSTITAVSDNLILTNRSNSKVLTLWQVADLTITQSSPEYSPPNVGSSSGNPGITMLNKDIGAYVYVGRTASNTYKYVVTKLSIQSTPEGSYPFAIVGTEQLVTDYTGSSANVPVVFWDSGTNRLWIFLVISNSSTQTPGYIQLDNGLNAASTFVSIPEIGSWANTDTVPLSVVKLAFGLGLFASEFFLPILERVQPSSSTIDGLTKTECTADTPGEVWVLNP